MHDENATTTTTAMGNKAASQNLVLAMWKTEASLGSRTCRAAASAAAEAAAAAAAALAARPPGPPPTPLNGGLAVGAKVEAVGARRESSQTKASGSGPALKPTPLPGEVLLSQSP